MCTASIISTHTGFRVVVNRDEERDRPPALPPRWHDLEAGASGGRVRAIWPIDPLGGGTWIAASTRGLVLLVLNGNPEPRPERPTADRVLSRGSIILSLIASPTATAAIARASRELEFDRFPPFRLVAAATSRLVSLQWDGAAVSTSDHDPRACCFVSSGLGDRCVAVRLPLFDALVARAPGGASQAAQDRFHAHHWPDRPELSVLMNRAAARTISITTVEVTDAGATMRYRPVNEPRLVPRERAVSTRR